MSGDKYKEDVRGICSIESPIRCTLYTYVFFISLYFAVHVLGAKSVRESQPVPAPMN
jgi:hypothetical protein